MRTSCHRLLTDLRLSGVPGVGFVPFWCSGHGDCHDDSYYDAPTSAAARGWFSDSGGWEMIWHASCDVSDWSAAWPSGAPCTEYWDADGTVYVHFADADFCCVAYAAGSSWCSCQPCPGYCSSSRRCDDRGVKACAMFFHSVSKILRLYVIQLVLVGTERTRVSGQGLSTGLGVGGQVGLCCG